MSLRNTRVLVYGAMENAASHTMSFQVESSSGRDLLLVEKTKTMYSEKQI